MSKRSLFGRNKAIEREIDEFLDKVSEAALVLVAMLQQTLDSERAEVDDVSRERLAQMQALKQSSSGLRRKIEAELYTEMLIPDLLGDVARLIEDLHALVEDIHHAMLFLRRGNVETPDFVRSDGKEMVAAVGHAIEQLVQGARAYFRDFTHVRDHVHKVGFFEGESDTIRDRLLDHIYEADMSLAEKDHIARSVRELDGIADHAERIADSLTICAIKRAE